MSENRSSEGTLPPGVLPGLLRSLYVGRKSGVLHVTRAEERGSIRFRGGDVVSGGGIIRECLMGETFVRHGLLSQEQLDETLEAASKTGKRFGQVALDLGFLDQEALDEGLAVHVRDILLFVFSWSDGSYVFEEQDPDASPALDRPLRLSTAEVILDAVWSITDVEVVRRALGDLDRILVPASDPRFTSQQITLTPTDGFLLSRADGTLTARENLESCSVDREEAERGLLGLLCTGMVEFESEPSSDPEARPAEAVRPATPSAPSPDPPGGREGIAETLERAQQSFAAGRYGEALQIADDVLQAAAQGEIRRRARILKAKIYLRDSSRKKEAEEELRAAVWEDRDNAEAYYLLGRLYMAAGTETRARSMFRRVLALDPDHSGALAKIGEAAENQPQEGFLKKLINWS